MFVPLRRQRTVLVLFSFIACIPAVIAALSLRLELRTGRIFEQGGIRITGTVVHSLQREVRGERATYVSFEWTTDGKTWQGDARIVSPDGSRPQTGGGIALLADPADPSFAVPEAAYLSPGRVTFMSVMTTLLCLPPVFLWLLLAASFKSAPRQQPDRSVRG